MERPLNPPTEYYDEQVKSLDETIAASIATRHHLSNGRPGFPKIAYLEQWAQQYGIPISLLHQAFSALYHWDLLRDRVEPDRFERFVPVMAAQHQETLVVTVPYLHQYNNCSIVVVFIERAPAHGLLDVDVHLTVEGHTGRPHGGGGGEGHLRNAFVVTPPIPDDRAANLDMIVKIEPSTGTRVPESQPIPRTIVRFHSGNLGG